MFHASYAAPLGRTGSFGVNGLPSSWDELTPPLDAGAGPGRSLDASWYGAGGGGPLSAHGGGAGPPGTGGVFPGASAPPSFDNPAIERQLNPTTTAAAFPSAASTTYYDFTSGAPLSADVRLAYRKMDHSQLPTDDIAAQEAAAGDFQPDLSGPLVGEKTPSHVITEEYAKADPVYVQKTIALPQVYSHYRPIQGDGNCGWRAIGFGYFETLAHSGNKALVDAELARLKGLNDFIETVGGIDLSLFEGMVEHTFNLLESISHNINDSATALAHLMETFNDVEASNWIIYHLRLLASATLKGDPESNLGFITNPGGVPGHCASSIEVPGVEMEQLELNLLVTVLLKPAGLILEVAYLDRSAGSKVNTYRFPDEAQSQDPATLGPVIYVLYRPGHYDLLYRTPVDVSVNAVEVMIDLHNFASSTPTLRGFASANGAVLANIPGCSQMRPGLPVNTGSSEPPPPPPPPPPMDMYSVSNPASPWVLVPNGAGCVASQQPAESPMQNFRMAEQGIQTPTQAVDIYPGPETEAAFPALSTHSAIRPPFPAAKRPGRFDLPFPLHNPVPDLPSAGLPASNDEQPPQQRQPPPTTVALMLSPLQAQGDPMRSSKYNKEYAYTAHNPWRKPPAFGEEPPRQSVWVTKHYRHENFTPEQWVPALDGSGAVVLHAKVSKRYPKAAALRERREREAVEKEKRLRGAR